MRVTFEEYLIAVALILARRHRPVWSWVHWRRMCRCGAELPCRARHRLVPAPLWDAPTQIHPRSGPLMTFAAQWRSSSRARRL